MANRPFINNVLDTNEDAPEPVLIHVPPIIRQNGAIGTMYFNIEVTYMLEIECYHDSLSHPQKVSLSTRNQIEAVTHKGFNYNKYLFNAPNKHFHGHKPKGMVYGRGIHMFQGTDRKTHRIIYGKYVSK